MSLHALVGHRAVLDAVAAAHARGTLPQTILIHGARGIGKQRLALWIAQMAVCDDPRPGPCLACLPCRMCSTLEHPDVHWYFPLVRPTGVSGDRLADKLEEARIDMLASIRERPLRASHSDEVRALYLGTVRNIRQRGHARAAMAPAPVFIIGEAELLVPQESSQEAANALLKLLEEPPGGARFILTSSEPEGLLPTIRSRAVPIHLRPLPHADVAHFLTTHTGVAPERADWAARLAHGSIGRALGFLPDGDETGPLDAQRRQAFELVRAALDPKPERTPFGIALSFPAHGARKLLDLFSFTEAWLRDLAAVASGAEESVMNHDALDALRTLVRKAGIEAAAVPGAFPLLERARELARGNVHPQLVIAALLEELGAHFSQNVHPEEVS